MLPETPEKYLSQSEMSVIDQRDADNKTNKLTAKIFDYEQQLLKSEIDKIKLRLDILRLNKFTADAVLNNKTSDYTNFLKKLKEKYNIPQESGIGYDPYTGKLNL